MEGLAKNSEPGTVVLKFQHLYDNVWAVFQKKEHTWQRPRIIMPSGFQPELGVEYECRVKTTMYGTFTYNGIDYDLCYATWVESGNIIDLIEQKCETFKNNPLAEALKGIDTEKLPNDETIALEVQKDPKDETRVMFKPQYLSSDPYAGGRSSMRFFQATRPIAMQIGWAYYGRVREAKLSGKQTKRGAEIVNIRVEIID